MNDFFNNNIFKLNSNLKIKDIETKIGKITIIEDFYENINAINEEIEKIPITLVWENFFKKNNGTLFLDGRKTYISTMEGMRLPFIDELKTIFSNHFSIKKDNLHLDNLLIVNCFKKLKNYPENKYYNVHYDPTFLKDAADSQYAIVIFLNNFYEDGVGINIFYPIKQTLFNQFTEKNEVDLIKFIQAKPNMAVLFDYKYLHSQSNGNGKQFYDEWRYTQVLFPLILNDNLNNKNLKYL